MAPKVEFQSVISRRQDF